MLTLLALLALLTLLTLLTLLNLPPRRSAVRVPSPRCTHTTNALLLYLPFFSLQLL
jgi:hypothetical protein